jgi:hypothetical protein
MIIGALPSLAVSWFCYNSNDTVKLIALNGGDLPNGGNPYVEYIPPDNDTGYYYVRFTQLGGGSELIGGTLPKTGWSIWLLGQTSGGGWEAQVVQTPTDPSQPPQSRPA